VGPLIHEESVRKVERYVQIGIDEGATLLTGGHRATAGALADGTFFEPTIFTNVRAGSRLEQEEIFGPVLSVIAYDDEADAVRIANDTVYGLAAYVWGGDPERAVGLARRLRAGMVAVNGGSFIGAELPFGGRGQSGMGREWGVAGFEEFLELKTVGVGVASE
jgi:acyl-CoA reductase-like NAD-dependent aldehyde dehydrogenase